MNSTSLHIKNMVCDRCIKTVNTEISKLGYKVLDIELGKVEIEGILEKEEYSIISDVLDANAVRPIATFQYPMVLDSKASRPMPVL